MVANGGKWWQNDGKQWQNDGKIATRFGIKFVAEIKI
jgi:hypothetical protein